MWGEGGGSGTGLTYRCVGVGLDSAVEVGSFHDEEVVRGTDDAALGRDGARRVDVVAGHHANCDAGALALGDCLRHLRTTTGSLPLISAPQHVEELHSIEDPRDHNRTYWTPPLPLASAAPRCTPCRVSSQLMTSQ